jgi:N-acetylmuramoyl-L-alanine amidase
MSEHSNLLSQRESGPLYPGQTRALLPVVLLFTCVLAGCTDPYSHIDKADIKITWPTLRPRPPKPLPKPPVELPPVDRATGPAAGLSRIPGVRIVIDPGHGGTKPGAPAAFKGGLAEKKIVLLIANRLAKVLRACGAEVIQTRTRDVHVDLDRRAAISNEQRASLFVSIHADAMENRSSFYGTTLYVEPHAYARTVTIAAEIKKSIEQAGIRCNGIRNDQKYRVLVKNSRPAILIETGYMTNPADSRRLNSKWYRNKIAWVIARGITRHFRR